MIRADVRVFTTSFPRDAGDPSGRFVLEFAAGMAATGRDVAVESAVSTYSPNGITTRAWAGELGGALFSREGAPEVLSREPLAWSRALVASAKLSVRAASCRGRQRVSVGQWLVPCGPAAVAAGGRVVLYAHGSDVALLEGLPGGRALARALDGHADHLNFVSADLRRRFEALLGRPPRADWTDLPMGVAEPAPDFDALGLAPRDPGELRVVTLSRLVKQKGLDVLAHALADPGLPPGLTWYAAGYGPERQALIDLCRGLGVRLRLLGTVSPGARDALLASADIFVLPSRSVGGRQEGAPVSLLEAQLAGLPCIASRVGGVPDVSAPGGVALMPPDDPPALRAALTALLVGPDAEMRREAAGTATMAFAQRFRWAELMPLHRAAVFG